MTTATAPLATFHDYSYDEMLDEFPDGPPVPVVIVGHDTGENGLGEPRIELELEVAGAWCRVGDYDGPMVVRPEYVPLSTWAAANVCGGDDDKADELARFVAQLIDWYEDYLENLLMDVRRAAHEAARTALMERLTNWGGDS